MQDSAVAGACAGLVSSIITCPLDVVKTKLQAQGGPEFQPGTALSQGFKGSAGGISGGVGGGLNQLLFPASSGAVVGAKGGISATGAHIPHTGVGIEWPLTQEERLKQELQRREERRRYTRGLKATVRQIWEDDGFRGFYRGLGPTIFGYLPTWAIYFTVYDYAKAHLVKDPGAGAEVNFLNHILSAMAAGAASTVSTSPLWVVKTRFMVSARELVGGRPTDEEPPSCNPCETPAQDLIGIQATHLCKSTEQKGCAGSTRASFRVYSASVMLQCSFPSTRHSRSGQESRRRVRI